MNLLDFGSQTLIESRYARVGEAILTNGTVILHPLDLLRLSRPDLTPVERVMVLVDRVYNAAMTRIDA